jgi:hypothetical protein
MESVIIANRKNLQTVTEAMVIQASINALINGDEAIDQWKAIIERLTDD